MHSTTRLTDAPPSRGHRRGSIPSPGAGRRIAFICGLFALLLAGDAAAERYSYQSGFGSKGNHPGQFQDPTGIAIDPVSHNLLVADSANNRVERFSSDGNYLGQFGESGGGNGQFLGPGGMAIDPTTHNVVVTDVGHSRVQIFTSRGRYLAQFGTEGSGKGQFGWPAHVAIDPASHDILVTDASHGRVEIFSSTGSYLRQFGTPGIKDGQFSTPSGIAIDPVSRDIVVGDNRNVFWGRIQIFDSHGRYLRQFGTQGQGDGQFGAIAGIAIDPTRRDILVSDMGNQRVQVFTSAGRYRGQFGTRGSGNGQFETPRAIAIDPTTHRLAVTDGDNHRVQLFRRGPGDSAPGIRDRSEQRPASGIASMQAQPGPARVADHPVQQSSQAASPPGNPNEFPGCHDWVPPPGTVQVDAPATPDYSHLPRDAQGRPMILRAGNIELVPLEKPDALSASDRCADMVIGCTSLGKNRDPNRSFDRCFKSAPRCKTTRPWEEARACCPESSWQHYSQLRRDCIDPFSALMRTFHGDR
ncbi:MAG TPA: hypothetical protein VGH80_07645 [Xanthomonadaceae bacterium]|jgi:DNA-binding beta-propeller fold protein YncE